MNSEPTPNPNLNDRLKKIQAAQEDLANMTPSPEQIATEQSLELHAQLLKSNRQTQEIVGNAKTTMTAEVKKLLDDHRTRLSEQLAGVEDRICEKTVTQLKPAVSNEELRDRLNIWGATLAILAAVGIFVVIVTRR